MTVVIFLGPTMAHDVARSLLSGVYLPPASRGDVYTVAKSRPWAIAIIDGFFHRVPSVLHKEILWAMSRGIHVYGSSSMGALRAAELAVFGMIGVGKVFNDYQNGTLVDDDEVAIVHGSSETGYLRGSEAMVNIRATLATARGAGVIGAGVHDGLIALAKNTFYSERSYERILCLGVQAGLPSAECHQLRTWLPLGHVDVKRDDATELLGRIAADRDASPEPKKVSYRFNNTTVWENFRRAMDGRPLDESPGSEERVGDEFLDELRLRSDEYERERDRALVRVLAAELAVRRGETGDGEADSVTEKALVRQVRARFDAWLPQSMRDSLRESGRYEEVNARARDKQRLLAHWGLHTPSLADAGMSEAELWRWFFETVLVRPVPGDVAAYAAALDFADLGRMRRAVLRELMFRRKTASLEAASGSPVPAPTAEPARHD